MASVHEPKRRPERVSRADSRLRFGQCLQPGDRVHESPVSAEHPKSQSRNPRCQPHAPFNRSRRARPRGRCGRALGDLAPNAPHRPETIGAGETCLFPAQELRKARDHATTWVCRRLEGWDDPGWMRVEAVERMRDATADANAALEQALAKRGRVMARRRSLVSQLYRAARVSNNISAIASSNPRRVARRARNVMLGRSSATLGYGGDCGDEHRRCSSGLIRDDLRGCQRLRLAQNRG